MKFVLCFNFSAKFCVCVCVGGGYAIQAVFAKLNFWCNIILATIGNDLRQEDALEVDLEVAHPQTKEVNVEMTDGLEVEIETEEEKDLGAGIKGDLDQETESVWGETLISKGPEINWVLLLKSNSSKSILFNWNSVARFWILCFIPIIWLNLREFTYKNSQTIV